MFRKILLTFIVMLTACIVAFTINILNAQTVDTEKRERIAEISTHPSIVALGDSL